MEESDREIGREREREREGGREREERAVDGAIWVCSGRSVDMECSYVLRWLLALPHASNCRRRSGTGLPHLRKSPKSPSMLTNKERKLLESKPFKSLSPFNSNGPDNRLKARLKRVRTQTLYTPAECLDSVQRRYHMHGSKISTCSYRYS